MNRFKFRFSTVLRHREIIEMEKKRHFGNAMNKLRMEENKLDTLNENLNNLDADVASKEAGKISKVALESNFKYARNLEQKKVNQKKQIQKAEKILDSKRAELVEAMKQKKILERLKERELGEYEKAELKEEQAFIDEITITRFNKSPQK